MCVRFCSAHPPESYITRRFFSSSRYKWKRRWKDVVSPPEMISPANSIATISPSTCCPKSRDSSTERLWPACNSGALGQNKPAAGQIVDEGGQARKVNSHSTGVNPTLNSVETDGASRKRGHIDRRELPSALAYNPTIVSSPRLHLCNPIAIL